MVRVIGLWHEHLNNNKFISIIYTNVPSLNDVRIERIAISHEGDRISLGFDMPNYSDKPPSKWEGRGYTTTFIEIDFFDIREICLRSIDNTYRGNIDIKKMMKKIYLLSK
jgi:hypothetical protein